MKKITIIKPAGAWTAVTKTKVAAYCRVSTGMDNQLVSLDTQKSHYENLIRSNPDWEFAGLYYDEGITGTSTSKVRYRFVLIGSSGTTRIRMAIW